MNIELCIYGVRGSAPISGDNYIRYGGNTASYTLRTPSNTLIFLDAGTGLRIAEEQLFQNADQVYLMISHTHADHIQGFGITRLPYLPEVEGYEDQLLNIIGPPGITKGLGYFYDGALIWPVQFTADESVPYRMFGIDYQNIREYHSPLEMIQLDDSTRVFLLLGNHPVSGGVVLFRFELAREGKNPVVIVYATDNEFDFVDGSTPYPQAEAFKQEYKAFIHDADVLIADAQYTKHDYYHRFQGFGHSYHQQIIDLAQESGVRQLLLTHHHLYEDEYLDDLKTSLERYLQSKNCEITIKLAQEGQKLYFE